MVKNELDYRLPETRCYRCIDVGIFCEEYKNIPGRILIDGIYENSVRTSEGIRSCRIRFDVERVNKMKEELKQRIQKVQREV